MRSDQTSGGTAGRDPTSAEWRRAHLRLKCRGTAQVRPVAGEEFATGLLVDLSSRGCCIEWEEPVLLQVGTAVEIYLNMKGIALCLMGVIRYVHKNKRTGIEFTHVSPRKQEQIEAAMNEFLEMRRFALSHP